MIIKFKEDCFKNEHIINHFKENTLNFSYICIYENIDKSLVNYYVYPHGDPL